MPFLKFLFAKLREPAIWRRIFLERLTEPLHLNVLSLPVLLFGTFRQKVAFDLVLRQHSAYGILQAAEYIRMHNMGKKLAVCEFGVATGTGLMNMAFIARKVSRLTGVEIRVFGFDSGRGMPTPPADYRDHPEHYTEGDNQMDVAALKAKLPANVTLTIGEVKDTIGGFKEMLARENYAVGYAAMDVDYYTSTSDALKLFDWPDSEIYLPVVWLYLDDIAYVTHNPSAGMLLAVDEFNARSTLRKIYPDPFLENRRIFRRANWIKHMRYVHVLDHKRRKLEKDHKGHVQNPYL